jgi:hypothetical protein
LLVATREALLVATREALLVATREALLVATREALLVATREAANRITRVTSFYSGSKACAYQHTNCQRQFLEGGATHQTTS